MTDESNPTVFTKSELDKALKDEPHELERALTFLMDSFDKYKKEFGQNQANLEILGKHVETIDQANQDLVGMIRDLFLMLNAEREQALEIKNMKVVLDKIGEFLLSSSVIKKSIIANSGYQTTEGE